MEMSTAYEEILNILHSVEKEKGISNGLLKKIYELESDVIHLRTRNQLCEELETIIAKEINEDR